MNKKIIKLAALLLFIYSFLTLTGLQANALNMDSSYAYLPANDGGRVNFKEERERTGGQFKVGSRIYELLFGRDKENKISLYLIPGGEVFGIKLKEAYVTVSEAKEGSPLCRGDKIITVDGTAVRSADDISEILQASGGKAIKIEILRSGEKITITVTPREENGEYKLGVSLRRSASGIGTVTFIDPETGAFGGLGHGVCEPDTGNVVETVGGEVTDVLLGGVNRGEIGKPGELSGILGKKHIGNIDCNTECGIFGIMEDNNVNARTPIPVGFKKEIKPGAAEIISTVRNGKTARYKIEITEIDASSTTSKSFKIKVTDPTLIALTGGIVRGMSGSPIIQDGKLVGAVTHVLVANPTEGYGIFIENMLNASASTRNELPRAA